jgi:hypothetical protein
MPERSLRNVAAGVDGQNETPARRINRGSKLRLVVGSVQAQATGGEMSRATNRRSVVKRVNSPLFCPNAAPVAELPASMTMPESSPPYRQRQ